jgi:hypothetical protein
VQIGQACRLVETSAFQNACKACSDTTRQRRSHLERLRQTVQFLDLRASAIRGGSSQIPEVLQENPASETSIHLHIALKIAVIVRNNSTSKSHGNIKRGLLMLMLIVPNCFGNAQTSKRLNEGGIISSLNSLRLIGKRIHELQQSHGQTTGREMGMLQLWFCHVSIKHRGPEIYSQKNRVLIL